MDIDGELTKNSDVTDSTVTEMFFFIAGVAAGTTAATRPRSFNEDDCEPDANDVVAAFVVVVVVDLCVIAVVVVVVFVLVVVPAVTDFFETDDILSHSIFVASMYSVAKLQGWIEFKRRLEDGLNKPG